MLQELKISSEMMPFLLEEAIKPSLMLYDHFKARLEREIEDFGREKMTAAVAELRRLRSELEDRCIKKGRVKGKSWKAGNTNFR